MMNKKLTLSKKGENRAMIEESVTGQSVVSVGSNPGATILIDDSSVAPEQFVVIMTDDQFILLNSADGTRVNSRELSAGSQHILTEGDRIEISDYEVSFLGENLKLVDETGQPVDGMTERANGEVWKEEKTFEAGGLIAAAVKRAQDSRQDEKDFSKVLHEIRDEDSFYFHLKDNEEVIERIPFSEDEIWIGTRLGNVFLAADRESLDEVYCRVAKDWSGVVVFPRGDQEIRLNGEKIEKPERLRNEDVIALIDDSDEAEIPNLLSFHEPISLLALSAILPEDLPAPVSTESPATTAKEAVAAQLKPQREFVKTKEKVNLYLGYFTILEILIMAFGTIVTAAIIFFVLELV